MIWLSMPISRRLAAIWSGVRKSASGPVMARSIRATRTGMSASVAMRWISISGSLERVETGAQFEDGGQLVQRAATLVEQGGIGEVGGRQGVAVPVGGPDRQAGVELVGHSHGGVG